MPNGSRADLMGVAQLAVEQKTLEQEKEAEQVDLLETARVSRWSKLCECLAYVPPQCRHDPNQPLEFSIGLNLLFGIHMLQSLKYDLR